MYMYIYLFTYSMLLLITQGVRYSCAVVCVAYGSLGCRMWDMGAWDMDVMG